MLAEFACPLCEAEEWEIVGRRRFLASDRHAGSAAQRHQFSILFDRWAPGADAFETVTQVCRRCGFVCFRPRPTDEDMDKKYLAPEGSEAATAAPTESPWLFRSPDSPYDLGRARQWHARLSPYLRGGRRRVLDYGGADGRLMMFIAGEGHACFTVDYCPHTIEGVTRLAPTIEALDARETFDAILASQVLEHVVHPRQVLQRLASHLRPGGLAFIEVPMEVWRSMPPAVEPVTHVNFFTRGTVRLMIELCGLEVVSVRDARTPGMGGGRQPIVYAVARRPVDGMAPQPRFDGAFAATMAQLRPSPWGRLRHALADPAALPRKLMHRLTGRR